MALSDGLPFIWNIFEQQKYVTLFAEDTEKTSVFEEKLNGYELQIINRQCKI